MKVDELHFRIQENSKILEISNKKYILHNNLEFYDKKNIQSNKMVIPNKEYNQRKFGSFLTIKSNTRKEIWRFFIKQSSKIKLKSFMTRKTSIQQKPGDSLQRNHPRKNRELSYKKKHPRKRL